MGSTRAKVIIPAFNEAKQLPVVLEEIATVVPDLEVVVVDDGSTDDTAKVASQWGARVIQHPFNLGYGTALQTGYKYAVQEGTSLLVQMDADGQHDPRDIPKLLAEVKSGRCDLALGSRFLEEGQYRMGPLRNAVRILFRGIARLTGLALTDPTSGFQCMNRRVLDLYVNDFYPSDYPDVDVLLTAHRHSLRVLECPVTMSAGNRESYLHGGRKAIYYGYRMALSLWAVSGERRGT